VYFHGGSYLNARDLDVVRPFLDAGFAVMTPMLRGENDNPGFHELFYGEVDDARAAVDWLSTQPEVDPARVFAFGHDTGGVIAALLSCYTDTGLRLAGSSGGFYATDFRPVGAGAPVYDTTDPEEAALRTPALNADQLHVPHIGYVGDQDPVVAKGAGVALVRAQAAHAPLTIETIPGDHFSSLDEAVRRFLARAQAAIATP
jgi:dienelactone hydrolase